MRYLALAVDYDGTAASNDRLSESARLAIERLRISGRRIVLVSGRRLDDLMNVCPAIGLFDIVVAENGGVVYDPRRREETVLGVPPAQRLVDRLLERGVNPIEVGKGARRHPRPLRHRHVRGDSRARARVAHDCQSILGDGVARGYQQSERGGVRAAKARPVAPLRARRQSARERPSFTQPRIRPRTRANQIKMDRVDATGRYSMQKPRSVFGAKQQVGPVGVSAQVGRPSVGIA